MAFQVVHIEADSGFADQVRRAFVPAGFSVTTLAHGESAVERCRTAKPDLILLAAELPDMSGFSLCNRLKRALGPVPLILYTAEPNDSAIEAHRATRTPADDYLRHPFDIADLVEHAARILQAQPHSSAPDGAPRPPPPRPTPPPLGTGGMGAPPLPGVPPPVPAQRQRSAAGAEKEAPVPFAPQVRAEVPDPFADAPRDPAPPRGSPEEKLEFFRERLRVRDAFLGRVREAFGGLRAELERVVGEASRAADEIAVSRSHAAAAAEAAEARLQAADAEARARLATESEARAAVEAGNTELQKQLAEARAGTADLTSRLSDSEATRQSLSDVLSATMQEREAAEQDWSLRLSRADEERARLEAAREEDRRAAESVLGTRNAEWEARLGEANAEKAALESARAELEARLLALGADRDNLAAEGARLSAELAQEVAAHAETRSAADRAAEALRGELDGSRRHAEGLAVELAEARARAEAQEAELGRRAEQRATLEEELRHARAEAGAYGEKAVAAEQAWLAQGAELEALKRRTGELAQALDGERSSMEGARGRVTALEGELQSSTRELARTASERDQVLEVAQSERRAREQAVARVTQLEAETARLAELETQAAEATRLRRELAQVHEILQQRTQQTEAAARLAHDTSAERERLRERFELENSRLAADLTRREAEAQGARRRVAELEQDLATRGARAEEASAKMEAERQGRGRELAELEKRHAEELARLRANLVDLERRLEGSARAEAQWRRRAGESEKRAAAQQGAPAELARLGERLHRLEEEVTDLREENDFLNAEVARFTQKSKEAQTRSDGPARS